MTTEIWINYKDKHIAEAKLTLFLTGLFVKDTKISDIGMFPEDVNDSISVIREKRPEASYNDIVDTVISQWLLDRAEADWTDEELIEFYGIEDPGIGRMDIYKCPRAVLDNLDRNDGYRVSPKSDIIVNFTLVDRNFPGVYLWRSEVPPELGAPIQGGAI